MLRVGVYCETVAPGTVCPAECECGADFTKIKCKIAKTTRLSLPSVTKELYLQKDYIGPFQNNTVNRLLNLEVLDMSYNRINVLQGGVFRFMEKLRWLSLRGNMLTSLGDDLFQDNRNLEYLDLSHNLFRFLPDPSIRFMSNLKVFNISYNSLVFAKLGTRFQVTTKLEIMDFSGNDLGFISSDDLDIMTGWESRVPKVMNYSNCNLRVIEPDAIKNVKNLKELVLSNNVNLELSNLTDFLIAAQEVNLMKSDLSYTNLSQKINVSDLTSDTLGGLAIQELNLAGNYFLEIDDHALTYLTLKRLDLSKNQISSLSAGLAQLHNLVYLDLSDNKIATVDENFKTNLVNMEILMLSNNQLSDESGLDIERAVNLVDLDLSGNKLGTFSIPRDLTKLKVIKLARNKITLLNNNQPLVGLESLNRIDLSNNELTSLGAFMFRDSPNLVHADFSRNKIVDVSHQTFVPHSPRTLDLTHNNLTSLKHFGWHDIDMINLGHNQINEIEPQTFYFLDALQKLYLNDNNISAVDVNILSHVSNLTVLDMKKNHLSDSEMLHNLIKPLPKLKDLDVSFNKFAEIKTPYLPFANSHELVHLEMGDNHFSYLSPYVFTSLEKLETVDFSGNPFNCDCKLVPLQSWAQKMKVKIRGKENPGYKCKTPGFRNGKTLFNFTLRAFDCNKLLFYAVVISSVGGGVIVLAIAIAILCHLWLRYRKKKKVTIEATKPDLVGFKVANGTIPNGKSRDVDTTEMTLRENYLYNNPSDTLIGVEFENPMSGLEIDNHRPLVKEKTKEKKTGRKKAEKEKINEKKKRQIKKLQSDLKTYEKILKEVRFQNKHGSDNNVNLAYLDLSSAERKERRRKSKNDDRRKKREYQSDDELIERKHRPRGNRDLVRMLSSRHYRSMPDVVSYVNSLPRREYRGYPYSRIPIVHVDHPDTAHRGWVRSLIDIPRGRPDRVPSRRQHYENLKYALTHRPPGGYSRLGPSGYHTISSGYRHVRTERPDVEETFTKSLGRKHSQSTSGLSVWV